MCHLMYRSRSAISSADGMPVGQLGMLLEQCLNHNPAWRITGVLAFYAGRFIQVIEGPEAAVDQLFATIRRDRRHGQIELLLREPDNGRCFADWSMAFACRDRRLATVFGPMIAEHPPRETALSAVRTLAEIVA